MRHAQLSVGELTVDSIVGGGDMWRKKYYLNGAIGSDGADGKSFDGAVKTLSAGYALLETLKKDVLIFEESASSIALSAGFTWAKSLTGLVGTSENKTYQRSRISHSANFATLLTVSGYGNVFKNFRIMHGSGSATNLTALNITGAGNSFYNINVAGPLHATEGAEAGYAAVRIGEAEQYFNGCVFGADSATRAAGTIIDLVGSTTPRCIFENCLFYMNASANAAFFIKANAGLGEGFAVFNNCKFINTGTTLTYGIDGTGLGNFQILLDATTTFYGCTDIVAAANEASVISGVGSSATPAEDVSWHLALPVDHTA
jgi:hypothetical protein